MVLNSKCNTCKEPTKFVVGFYDGPRSKGCVYDCTWKDWRNDCETVHIES